MAFDRENPEDLLALKNEVNIDPLGMGYAAVAGATQPTLDLLNLPANNVGGETINRPISDILVSQVSEIIGETEYAALSEYDKEWVKAFIRMPADGDMTPYVTKFLEVFPAAGVTRTAAQALLPKLASRTEILFGVNTVLTRTDLTTALNS